MAAVDQLPQVPERGAEAPVQPGGGDLSALLQSQQTNEDQQDVQEVMQATQQRLGGIMRQVEGIASTFPAASKEADTVRQALDALVRAIVRNSPDASTNASASPMVSA